MDLHNTVGVQEGSPLSVCRRVLHCRCVGGCILLLYRRVLHCRCIGAVYCRCTGGFSTVGVQEGSPLSVCRGLYTVTVQEGSPLSVYRGCILSVYRRVLHCRCTGGFSTVGV